jgi:putative transposase
VIGRDEYEQNPSRTGKRERGIWQRSPLGNQIRNERDLQRHVDYIHYNPVKHGLVERVEDWPWSTYHRYIREDSYPDRSWNNIQNECEKMFIRE